MNNQTEVVNKVQKEKIPELQLVRAMAIMGVLCVHSTSDAVSAMTGSGYFFIYNFFNIFMKLGTPTFIFLSSFVLFYNYYSRPLTKSLITGFFKKRLLYIIIPYLLFSVFYFAIVQYLYYPDRSFVDTMTTFGMKLITGKAYTHLYFVFISIQFYFLFPLVLWLFKSRPAISKWAIPIGLTIQWAFVLINKYYLTTPVPNKGSWSLSYASYFFLGAFIGIYYPKLKVWIMMNRENANPARIGIWLVLWLVWLVAGISHVYIWYQTRLNGVQYNSTLYELLWNVHTYTFALVSLQVAHIIYYKGSSLLVRPMERLGALSFGIYLIHPFFLLIYRRFPPVTGTAWLIHLWYLGGIVTALVGSWIVVSLTARFIPYSWIIFGNLPKPKRKPSINQRPGTTQAG
ncbi:MAG TPA: acyltransferase [Paenibacillus sp.]